MSVSANFCNRVTAAGLAALAAWPMTVGSAVAQAPAQLPLAPTIERVIVVPAAPSQLEGAGTPGSTVRVIAGGHTLGQANVESNGRWVAQIKDGLSPGEHQLQVQSPVDGGDPVWGDEVRIAVPAALGEPAVVSYAAEAPANATPHPAKDPARAKAEAMARDAAEAYRAAMETVGGKLAGSTAQTSPQSQAAPRETAPATPQSGPQEETTRGPLDLVVEWLKRSARAYNDEIVPRLSVPVPGAPRTRDAPQAEASVSADEAPPAIVPPLDTSKTKDAVQKPQNSETEKKAVDAAAAKVREPAVDPDAARRKREADQRAADELARRKAESDARIAKNLKDLESARREADAKAAAARAERPDESAAVKPKPRITLERFWLPGERDGEDSTSNEHREATVASRTASKASESGAERGETYSGRCKTGRVIRKGKRRWYVTGRDDTLWDIAQRFYGHGMHYPVIYKANRSRLSSPHIVRPCQRLVLPRRRA